MFLVRDVSGTGDRGCGQRGHHSGSLAFVFGSRRLRLFVLAARLFGVFGFEARVLGFLFGFDASTFGFLFGLDAGTFGFEAFVLHAEHVFMLLSTQLRSAFGFDTLGFDTLGFGT
ncbi:hypothetical protein ABE093_00525, partial [Solilutibacter silvestris]